MLRKTVILLLAACLFTLPTLADKQAEDRGDSIYDRLVEYSITRNTEQLFKEKDAALDLFKANQQWSHYYIVSTICSTMKVLTEGQTLTGLKESRKLYEYARDNRHDYGRGIVLAQIAWLVLRIKSARRLKKANDQLQEAYDQLEETTTAKERIESELRIARDIQQSMLPSQFPTCDRLDLYATMTPAKEVGGDLYDTQLIDGCRLYFCVGDVSGKGVPASLFMAQTIRLFRAMAKQGLPPADIATYMNRELCEGNDSAMFVTMFIGVIQLETGQMDFCNCGHNPPVVIGALDSYYMDMQPNAPIGIIPELTFNGETITDIRNQPLLVYTDGLNEAEDPSQQQLGDDRLLDYVRHTPFTTAQALINGLTTLVSDHRAGAEPNDDLTMLCLHLKFVR